jgi:hypothetical protein
LVITRGLQRDRNGPRETVLTERDKGGRQVLGIIVDRKTKQQELRRGTPSIIPKVMRSRRIWMNSLASMAISRDTEAITNRYPSTDP